MKNDVEIFKEFVDIYIKSKEKDINKDIALYNNTYKISKVKELTHEEAGRTEKFIEDEGEETDFVFQYLSMLYKELLETKENGIKI